MSDPRVRLREGAALLGIALSDGQLDQFDGLRQRLIEGARALNLTSIIEPTEVVDKHFLDSLSLLSVLPARSARTAWETGAVRLIDVGSGAGFPGIPLAIARPDLSVTLLEATRKKVVWMEETLPALGLRRVRTLAGRAEEVAHSPEHRGMYGVAVARAVAPLAVLCELCQPFLLVGGRMVAQKTVSAAALELPVAERALSALGGHSASVASVVHPSLPNRALVLIEQGTLSPVAYPRRPGVPAKNPLL